jgi:signal transduction histidine kinase
MPEFVDIGQGLIDTRAVMEGRAHKKGVAIDVEVAPDLPRVYAFGGEINQIWEQLLDNALDAVGASGHIRLTAAREGPTLVVCVIDDGPGIPDEVKGRIFDPFFTTKGVSEGVGLGLDIARRIVRWHGGSIDVTSQPGRTAFRVALPVDGAAVPRGAEPVAQAPQEVRG